LESTRTSEAGRSSREILKHVDQLVKSNNLEKALQEVKKARELDPKNLYAFAYEERIHDLFIQQQNKKTVIPPNPKNAEIPSQVLTPYNLHDHIIQDHEGMSDGKVPALYEEFKRVGLRSLDPSKQTAVRRASKEALDTYKQALLLVWSDGQKTKEDIVELQDLRQSLGISIEEHEALDKQAKLECYIFLLKHLLQHASQPEVKESLEELRKSFDVSTMDQLIIDENLLLPIEKKKNKSRIAVIDDDEQLLMLLKETLLQAKYDVAGFRTSDEALEFFLQASVDLVLCDINLETSTMNGFLFYEKTREIPHMQQVPFIVITGLADDVLIRAGKEIGVDDFLVKPIHREDLLASVHGKIKRYEQLKQH
jgi:CheY-like chemotaxis protein